MAKVTALTEISSPATGDFLYIVDVSDTTDDPSGSSRKIQNTNLIAPGTITNAKLANVATATFKGRTTAGSGAPEDLNAAQATALLNTFTATDKGLAPLSGGGTTNFLRADGAWAAPAGGGGITDSKAFFYAVAFG